MKKKKKMTLERIKQLIGRIPMWADFDLIRPNERSTKFRIVDNRVEFAAKLRRIKLEKARAESLEKQKESRLLSRVLAMPM